MRKIYLLLLLLGCSVIGIAQKNGVIKGVAFDTLANQPVAMATITVLEKKDSSLVTFSMTDSKGNFELKGLSNGEYRLMITHINYHNNHIPFTIDDDNKLADLGQINLLDAAKVLSEVVVRNEAPPITLVGDTVQYNAGSFRVQPNSNVEELLKKLPGVKVDKDGNVTAQGEKVNRVLVDGKEFFGNDPKIATRNLPADAVDKVQVYDRQSDQAQLTGFDDGNYEKTINLKLKEDKKKGLFGKIMAGAGDRERYESRFNVNSFKGARQMSALGMANNTNAEGFSFMDLFNFTRAMNQMRQGGGGNMTIQMSGDEAAAFGMSNNRNAGINTAWAGGINYNNIIGTRNDFQSNYFYNRFNPQISSRVLRQNFIPGGSNFYNQQATSDNLNNSHRLQLNNLFQIDSFHSLRINPSFNQQQTRQRSQTQYGTQMENGTMLNDGYTNQLSDGEGFNFTNNLVFRKKFKRPGRTFSLSLTTTLNQNEGIGSLESIINYYTGGNINRRDTLNQQNTTQAGLQGYNTKIVYTEPLWRKSLLELSAGRSNMKNTSEKITYDYNKASGKYDGLNELLSNNFENIYGYTNAGLRLRKQGKKYQYLMGLSWQQANLEGKIIMDTKDSILSQRFDNLLPNASFRYNFSRFRSASITYTTNTNQPTLSQLQPVPDVSNPLYIREGNPDLKQEFSHMLRANLNLLSPYKSKSLFMFITAMMTNNRIVNNDSVELATGIRRTRPVNVDGVYNITSNISYSMPLRFIKATLEVSSTARYNRGKQFINNLENDIRTLSLGPLVRLDINATDKLNIGAGAQVNINRTKYSLPSAMNNDFLSQEYNSSIGWQLPKQFFFYSEFTYTVNTRRAEGFNTNIPIWNASFSKQFLKYNRGEVKLAVTDLLNRNTGITRNANQNFIEDREVNTLRRFFLLSFTYSLSKSGLGSPAPGGARMIIR